MNNYIVFLILLIVSIVGIFLYFQSNRVTSQNGKSVGRILSEVFGNDEEKENKKDKDKTMWG